ncbi:hypothetical protein ACTQ34_11980 [Agathobaculum sp. LCP25S3_E8]|uniref:hypothetical protein n=1 Tax=Agathobaculum sp. LCP25S3_E8 TaxID=3438735 RepID=UPI003F93DE71
MMMPNITLSPERRAAILQQLHSRRTKPRWTAGRIALAAILAALLTFSAFAAAIPAIRAALQNALGSFSEQSQPITGIAVEDNGIEVRPVAALASSNLVRVWVEVQDKTGDRLSDDMLINGWIDHEQDKDTPAINGWRGGERVVYYDENSRTALIEIDSIGRPVTDGAEIDVSFSSFQPSARAAETVDFPREMLSVTGLKNMTPDMGVPLFAEHIPLIPEQTPCELEGSNRVRLSSVGFGEDGKLHIQVAFLGEANHSGSTIHSRATDERNPEQHLGGGRYFQYNDQWYFDEVFDITPEDLPYLTFGDLQGTYQLHSPVEGIWSCTITVETADEVVYHPNVQVGGALVEEIRVSEIGISARSSSKGTRLGYRPTYAITKDGEKLYLTNNCIDGGWGTVLDDNGDPLPDGMGYAHDQWEFDEPLDPSDIVLLNFDGVDVPLQ